MKIQKGDNVIVYAGYSDFSGEVLEVTNEQIILKKDKKEIININIKNVYAISYIKK